VSVQERCGGVPFKVLCKTQAFQTADTAWPFESWDDKQWDKIVKEAKKELTKGA
jgi:hypothetical protein